MMRKYFKNLILCGEVNYHCLLCLESFKIVEDLEKHIRWEKHRKAIKNQTYLPKFKKDNIYKIGQIFYCEICNFATDFLDEISDHVKGETHMAYKGDPEKVPLRSRLPKRSCGGVDVDDTYISNEQWNGIFKKHCLFCDEGVKNVSEHIGGTKHIIKLIAAETFKENGQYYRKIKNNIVFCYLCKKTFEKEELTDHYNKTHSDEAKSKKQNERCKKQFDVDYEDLTAICRICNRTVRYTYKALLEHKEMHFGKKSESQADDDIDEDLYPFYGYKDHGKLKAELKEFGKNNFIKLNSGGSKGYCSLCDISLVAHIFNFKEHVKGKIHTAHLELKGLVKKSGKPEKMPHKLKPINQVVEDMDTIKELHAIMINSEIPLKLLSFMFLLPLDENKMKCFVCDEVFSDDIQHYKSDPKHLQKMIAARVVVANNGDFIRVAANKAEFIREARPGVYHCGYCNQVYPGWKLLERHFESSKHRDAIIQSHELFKDALESQFGISYEQAQELISLQESLDLE